MNWSKNLYVFMLGALIVFSGCFGTGTTDGEGDADTAGTTVINNYYNNTTVIEEGVTHWYENGEFLYSSEYDQGVICEDPNYPGQTTWCGTPAQWFEALSINQSIDEAIALEKVEFYALFNYSTSGTSYGILNANSGENTGYKWTSNCSNGMAFEVGVWTVGYTDPYLPFPGVECVHTLHWKSNTDADMVWWGVAYEVIPMSEGPHI
jgi:hypothetical protein